jgi:regulator of PEP synthase PpsR (kinase-PPPase family)
VTATNPLIVGLVASPDRLAMIRKNRLLSLNENAETDYVDKSLITSELADARRLCNKHGWQVIDVTRRSIEETSAAILNLYSRK